MTALSKAADKLAPLVFDPASNVHTVYEGTKIVNGVDTGEPAVVAVVGKKLPESVCRAYHVILVPHCVEVGNGVEVPVDVQEASQLFDGAPFRIQLLRSDEFPVTYGFSVNDHQRCFSPTIPGGVQISPLGASWVGTCGLPWTWTKDGKTHYGFVTNRHVAGLDNRLGHAICQPHARAGTVGTLAHFEMLNTVDPNEFDVALYDSEVNGRHLVSREIFGLGPLKPDCVDLSVGDAVAKSGRTTAITRGKCVGRRATTTVNYGPGRNLKFVGCDLIELATGGDFSAPGDSGSCIVKDGAFASLLFAGGGGKTLSIPATSIQRRIGGGPF